MNLSSTGRVDATLAFVGLLLALPAIYFFTGSFLKYEMNLLSNIEIIVFSPSVLIGGLLVAIVLNLFSLFRLKSTTSLEFTAAVVIREKALNIAIAGIALLFLALLLGYVFLENLAERGYFSRSFGGYAEFRDSLRT